MAGELPQAPKVTTYDRLDRAASLMTETDQEFVVMVDELGRPKGYLPRDVCKGQEGTAGEFGAALPATVRLDEDLRTAVSMMFMYDVPWLTCVDADGVYAGVITQRGVTRLLGETYKGQPH